MENGKMYELQILEECKLLEGAEHLKTDDSLNILLNNTEIGTSNNILVNKDEEPLVKNIEIQFPKLNLTQEEKIKDAVSLEAQIIDSQSDVINKKNESQNIMNKTDASTSEDSSRHKFKNPELYEEFFPALQKLLEKNSPNTRSTPDAAGETTLQMKQHAPHIFLSIIDTVLVILENTLGGAYRILQNYKEPQIPLVISNTMHSVRLAVVTLKDHFGFTNQKHYEPTASILRELLSSPVGLFQEIYADLKIPNLEYYNELLVNEEYSLPNPQNQNPSSEFMATNVNGTTMFEPFPTPEPRIVPRIPLFLCANQDPSLGVVVTGDGFVRVQLPCTFQIDFTIDQAILVRNLKDKTGAAISASGILSGLQTKLCRVFQHGKTVEINIMDSYKTKNMFAKMNERGIQLGGTGAPTNVHLKDNGEIHSTETSFRDLDDDFIKNIFTSNSICGPEYYNICTDSLELVQKKIFVDGSLELTWKDIKIKQYKTGEIVISRNNWSFFIWCCPEIICPFKGTGKKGIIKVVTPLNRIVSTVISCNNKQKEKYLLANIGKHWVYYTNRDFIMSNEVYSAGYNESTNNKDEA